MRRVEANEATDEFHLVTVRESRELAGQIKVRDDRVIVSLCPPFQYFGGWDPLDAQEDWLTRGRLVLEELADTWVWLLRTPDFLADSAALSREVASLSWFVSEEEISRRLGGCFGDDGELLVEDALWAEVNSAWDSVFAFSERYLESRVLAIARARSCPHPLRIWQAWNLLAFAPEPLPSD